MKDAVLKLDTIANDLESRGLKKFASRIDVISNSLESVSQNKKDGGPSEEDGGDD
jgi:hypothetical protein